MLRLHYEDYAECVSEHNLIRVKAFVEAQGENEPIMTVDDIQLSMPELLIQVNEKGWTKLQSHKAANQHAVALKSFCLRNKIFLPIIYDII